MTAEEIINLRNIELSAQSNRQEHFRNAFNYFVLAASGHRVGTVSRYETNTYATVDNEYDRN